MDYLNDAELSSFLRIYEQRECYLSRKNCFPNYKQGFFNNAYNSVPYYIQHFKNRPFEGILDESAFPIVSRNDIKILDDFLSTEYKDKNLIFNTTSGTSGVPLTIARDKGSMYSFLHHGFSYIFKNIRHSDQFFSPGKIGIVLVDDLGSSIVHKNLNPSLNYSYVLRLSIGQNPAADSNVVKKLRKMKLKVLYGRPRALEHLALLDSKLPNGRITPKVILTSGDNLYSDIQNKLRLWFECVVYNSYAMQECGFLGCECEFKTGLHIFEDITSVKLINDTVTFDEGEGKGLITCYENWAQPIINYKTDDFLTIQFVNCKCGFSGKSILEIKGRNSPYFYFDGKPFNPSHYNKIFEVDFISQFQMTQNGQTITLKIVPTDFSKIESMDIYLKNQINKITPTKFLNIIYCSEIEVDKEKKVQRYIYEK